MHGPWWPTALSRAIVQCCAVVLLAAGIIPLAAPATQAAVPSNSVYTWGSRPGGSAAVTYGTPVRGTGTVSTSSTSSSNPGGGGTVNALLASGSPVNKLSVLNAFGGGRVVAVIESPRTRTMYAGVEAPDGTHQLWQWSTSYLNPTLYWTAASGEEIVTLAGSRDASNRQAQAMVTSIGGGHRVYTWGHNDGYWTGRGVSSGSTSTPTEVTALRDADIRGISVGYLSMTAFDSNGDVWVWGNDSYSQLGLTTTTAQSTPVKLTDANALGGVAPSGVLEIAMGHVGVMARTSTGLITWGYTAPYAGRTASPTYPTALTLTGCTPTSIAWSAYYSSSWYVTAVIGCTEGGAQTWGNNTYGQLGNNSTTASNTPVTVQGLPSGVAITQVEGGAGASFAMTSSGAVYGWGSNLYRQLGIAANYTSSVKIYKTAQSAARVVHPSSGTLSSMWANEFTGGVMDSSGSMFTWGNAAYGLLGRGTKGPTSTATGAKFDRVGSVDGTGVDLMDSTDRGTVMVLSDGSVWTSGYNNVNTWNNGDGGSGSRLWPGKIDLPIGPDTSYPNETIEHLSCGANHCLVATSDGRIFGWGDQTYKQILPTASTAANAYNTPTLVVDLTSVPRIAAGRYFSLYVEPGAGGGTVYGWGYNSNRAASPDGAVTTALTAFSAVTSVSNVVDVSAGWYHSSVLRADGTVAVWGSNGGYEFGNMTKTNASPYWGAPSLPSGASAVAVQAAGRATMVRTSSGKLVAWGTNNFGFLGSGSNTALTSPAYVATSLTNDAEVVAVDSFISQVTTSAYYTALTVAIDENGQVWSWGANYYGQLGADVAAATSGANAYKYSPQQVKTSSGSQLSAGSVPVAGAGWGATFTPVSTGSAPSEPLSTSATPGNGQVQVTWSAPSTPADLRSYTVIARSGSTTVGTVGVGSGTTSATVTGLTNGTTYTFTVTATNEYGTSPESTSVTSVPVSVPSAPRNLAVTPSASSVTVAFDDPSASGGSDITGYTVTTTRVSDSTVVDTQAVAASGGRPVTVSGLTAGTGYSVAVTASNAQGTSLAATQSLTIVGRPTAPQDVTAEARVASAEVSWSAPSSDGGAAIAAYYVRAYSSGTTSLVSSDVVSPSTTSTTLTGLTDGTAYDVTVTAAQDATAPPTLLGVESDVAAVIPGRPSAPTNVEATPGNTGATVTWSAVADVTGIAVTGYTISHDTGGAATTVSVATSACSGGTCTGSITGLTNGTTYNVKVAANSADGAGPYSSVVTTTPRTVPTAPQGLAVTVADGGLDVEWTAPSSTGGSSLTAYTITVSDGSSTVYERTISSVLEAEQITGLDNGVAYSVSVVATNDAGAGPAASNSATPLGPPSAPLNLVLTPGTTSFTATWDDPASTGGSPVTSYTVSVIDPQEVVTVKTTTSSGTCLTSTRTCAVTQVDDGSDSSTLEAVTQNRAYTVSVVATNAQGDSSATTDTVVVTGQPSAPREVVATSADESFEVCLRDPATIPTGSITGYQLRVSSDGGASYSNVVASAADWSTSSPSCTGGKKAYTVSDLGGSAPVNGTQYEVLASATVSTDPDSGDWIFGMDSTAVSVTPMTTPGAVATMSAQASGDGAVTVTWSAPSDTGGSALTGYALRYLPASGSWSPFSGSLAASDTSATVTGLVAGTLYTFELTATNAVGAGTAATDTERAITVPQSATVTSPAASSTVTSLVVRFTYVTSTAAPVTAASIIAVPSSGATVTQSVNLGADCTLGDCVTAVSGVAGGSTSTVTVRLTNGAGSTDTSVTSITVLASSESGSGGGSGSALSPEPSASPSPSASEGSGSSTGSDTSTGNDDSASVERCLVRAQCSGWDDSDGIVRGADGQILEPIDDTSRWPDLPVQDSQPVDGALEPQAVSVIPTAASRVEMNWASAMASDDVPDAGSSPGGPGYLLQLRRVGASQWTTFESSTPMVGIDIAERGYLYEVRVLSAADFALAASSARFGSPLGPRESLTMSERLLAAQRPQTTVMQDPSAKGGSVLLLEGSSTMAQFRSTGDRLTLWFPTGPGLGIGTVVVDGQVVGTIDQRGRAGGASSRSFRGLGAGPHCVVLVVTGGPRVGIDAIASKATCDSRCLMSPTGAVPSSRGGEGAATGRRVGASVGFVASRVQVSLSGDARAVDVYVDGRRLKWTDRRLKYSGNRLMLSGLPARPHLVTVLPIDPGGSVTGAVALGRKARVPR